MNIGLLSISNAQKRGARVSTLGMVDRVLQQRTQSQPRRHGLGTFLFPLALVVVAIAIVLKLRRNHLRLLEESNAWR